MARPALVLVLAIVGGFGLASCTGLPDRQQEADRLESEIRRLPGVEDVSTIYSNDFTAGSDLNLDVTMTEAPEGQIAEVSRRIAQLKGTDFEGYNQQTTFRVGDRLTVDESDTPNPAQLGDRARKLRHIGATTGDVEATWTASGLKLEATDDAAALAAARDHLGPGPLHIVVMPLNQDTVDSRRIPMWQVDFPFDAKEEQRIRRQLAGTPVKPNVVTVEGNHISGLSVGVQNLRTAYADLTATVAAFRPTPQHPLWLEWDQANPPSHSELRFSGSVHVSGCQYPKDTAGEKAPQASYTPEAIDLQRQLRDEFDTCP